jgi:hypothetical protein
MSEYTAYTIIVCTLFICTAAGTVALYYGGAGMKCLWMLLLLLAAPSINKTDD